MRFASAGRALVRLHYTRYWTVSGAHAVGACVTSAPGGWTAVSASGPGVVHVVASFSLGRALGLDGFGSAMMLGNAAQVPRPPLTRDGAPAAIAYCEAIPWFEMARNANREHQSFRASLASAYALNVQVAFAGSDHHHVDQRRDRNRTSVGTCTVSSLPGAVPSSTVFWPRGRSARPAP